MVYFYYTQGLLDQLTPEQRKKYERERALFDPFLIHEALPTLRNEEEE